MKQILPQMGCLVASLNTRKVSVAEEGALKQTSTHHACSGLPSLLDLGFTET
jgi:hypothetical protein